MQRGRPTGGGCCGRPLNRRCITLLTTNCGNNGNQCASAMRLDIRPMLQFRETAARIGRLCEEAFSDVARPSDELLLRADSGDDLDVRGFYGGIWGQDWRAIPPDVIEMQYASLSAFSPEALHFYLPAYVTHALSVERTRTGSVVLPSLVWALTPGRQNTERLSALAQRLTDTQGRVLLRFLELVRDEDDYTWLRADAQRAIDWLWSKYG
jgi:hypothetical protein